MVAYLWEGPFLHILSLLQLGMNVAKKELIRSMQFSCSLGPTQHFPNSSSPVTQNMLATQTTLTSN